VIKTADYIHLSRNNNNSITTSKGTLAKISALGKLISEIIPD